MNKKLLLSVLSTGLLATTVLPVAQARELSDAERASVVKKPTVTNPYDKRVNPVKKPILPTQVKPEEPKKPVAGTPISNSRNPLNLPKGPITVRTNGNAGNVAVPGGVRRYETPQYRTLNELERRTFAPGVTKAVNPYKTRINPVKKPVAPTEVKPVEQKKPVAGKAVSNSRNPLNLSKGPITIKR